MLGQLDGQLMLFLNGLHTAWLDPVMYAASGRFIWAPLYLLLAVMVIRKAGWRNACVAFLLIALTIAAADQLCSSLLRPRFCRMRPSNPDNPISAFIHIVNDYRGGRYGFPSCHAANTFALVVFLARTVMRRTATSLLLLWAAFVSYTRIYLGVHYPGDLAVGAAIGSGVAWCLSSVYQRVSAMAHPWRSVVLGIPWWRFRV